MLTESTTREICAQVASGDFDAGLLRYPVTQATELSITPVEKDELVAVLPEGNPLLQRPALRLRDLADQPFINYRPSEVPGLHALVVLACQNAGFMPQVKQHAVQAQTLVSLVGAGLGWLLARRRFAGRQLVDALVSLPLVVAGSTLYVLHDEGRLTAWR